MATWRCKSCGYQSLAAPEPGSACPRCGDELASPHQQAAEHARKNPPKKKKKSWWDRFKTLKCVACGTTTTGLEVECPNCGGKLKDVHGG